MNNATAPRDARKRPTSGRQIYREDYLLYERLRKMDVGARVDHAVAANPMYTQVATVVGASVVGTIYSD